MFQKQKLKYIPMKTRNHFLSIVLGGAIALFTTNCDNDNNSEPQKPKPDGAALQSEFSENLAKAKQQFTLNAATGGSLTGKEGTVLQFFPNAFKKQNGDPVTGEVNIEF